MKKLALLLFLLAATELRAEVNVNVNVGVPLPPPVPVYVPPPPAPVYVAPPPQVVFQAPPEFLQPRDLGFYVAVGVAQDLFFVANNYYLFHNNRWYRSPRYDGNWVYIEHRALPPKLYNYRNRVEYIREIRERDHRRYKHSRKEYDGRYYKPEKDWKREKKEFQRERKEDRREDRRDWKEEKNYEKEQRKEHKRHGRDD